MQVSPTTIEALAKLDSLIPQRSASAHKRLGRMRLGRWRLPRSQLARWRSAPSLLVGLPSAVPEFVGSKSTSSLFGDFALLTNCRPHPIAIPRANYAPPL